jgi:hypothetical protein
MGLQDDGTWDIYTDRKNFKHEVKAFPQDDGEIVLECGCTWGTSVKGWSGTDEEGNEVGTAAEKFVRAVSNAHLLSMEQWPYRNSLPKKDSNWPNQPPIEVEGDS